EEGGRRRRQGLGNARRPAWSPERRGAVAIRNGGGVLGVVSLAAPTEHAADIASEAAHQAAWLAAAALSRILSNYGVPARWRAGTMRANAFRPPDDHPDKLGSRPD